MNNVHLIDSAILQAERLNKWINFTLHPLNSDRGINDETFERACALFRSVLFELRDLGLKSVVLDGSVIDLSTLGDRRA